MVMGLFDRGGTMIRKSARQTYSEYAIIEEEIHICKMCGKKLKNKDSQVLEYGPTCYKKYLKEKAKRLERRLF